MKFQVNVGIEVLKKSLKTTLFLYVIILINILMFNLNPHTNEEIITKLNSFILLPNWNNYGSINLLSFLYYFSNFIYIAFLFSYYEKFHSYENIALRYESKKYLLYKILIGAILSIIYTTIYYIFVHYCLSALDKFNIYIYFKYASFFLVIMIYAITIVNESRKMILLLLIAILNIILYLHHFNFAYLLVGFIFCTIYNLCFLNIKKGYIK